jgi:hypothetical protein
MATGNKSKIEGGPSKRFRLYRVDINNEPHECIGQYDTVGEVWAEKRRVDWRYKVKVEGQSLTLAEFSQWAKEHFWECGICGQTLEIQDGDDLKRLEGYVENCKLREHMVGDECIARRQRELARKLISKPIEG